MRMLPTVKRQAHSNAAYVELQANNQCESTGVPDAWDNEQCAQNQVGCRGSQQHCLEEYSWTQFVSVNVCVGRVKASTLLPKRHGRCWSPPHTQKHHKGSRASHSPNHSCCCHIKLGMNEAAWRSSSFIGVWHRQPGIMWYLLKYPDCLKWWLFVASDDTSIPAGVNPPRGRSVTVTGPCHMAGDDAWQTPLLEAVADVASF